MARRSSKHAPGKIFPPPEALMTLVEEFSYEPDPIRKSLTNIVFWAGAGFSKAWEPSSPVGSQLFTIDGGSVGSFLFTLADHFGTKGKFSYEQFRQLIYQLDMYERYPDLRSRYFDAQNIAMARSILCQAVAATFSAISRLNYIEGSLYKFPLSSPTKSQKHILRFFTYLRERSSGAGGVSEGLRPQFITTNYDYVIETILDNIIPDEDDSLFNYTYRGITPTKVLQHPNPRPLHDHQLVNHLLKLNGGFEILDDGSGYVLDYSNRSLDDVAESPPLLILPSREQQYTNPYFQAVFPKAVRLMRESRVFVLVGYSLPPDDALMRFIIRQFAEEREDGFGKYLFYVDLIKNRDKLQRLSQIFPWAEDRHLPTVFLYEGGFADFAEECGRFIP
jgi:hypothetical protein